MLPICFQVFPGLVLVITDHQCLFLSFPAYIIGDPLYQDALHIKSLSNPERHRPAVSPQTFKLFFKLQVSQPLDCRGYITLVTVNVTLVICFTV